MRKTLLALLALLSVVVVIALTVSIYKTAQRPRPIAVATESRSPEVRVKPLTLAEVKSIYV